MKNLKKMLEEDQQLWKDFAENVEMIIGFEDACNKCASFISKYGTYEIPLLNLESEVFSTEDLLEKIMDHYIKSEEFEKCAKLHNINESCCIPSQEDIESFLENSKCILSFDDNCIIAAIMFKKYNAFSFYSLEAYNTKDTLDYLDLTTKLVNYFHDKKDFKTTLLFSQLREEVLIEMEKAEIFDMGIFKPDQKFRP